ncbi:peptidoglycan editing factor PgeF [Hydrogenophaga sp. 5NK40-0174]|uniref:peptidoglycan editing factor PgeF n=1 Tax=Hydrogenophaga sp. 5NK40-0174 TaxID=3127649 RepID=UPI003102590A
MSQDWIVPQWPAPDGVGALFTTRAGGISSAPYDTLNLGGHVGDDAAAVQHNRQILTARIPARPVFLRQVHGLRVSRLNKSSEDGQEADACFSTEMGMACTIMVADCLPVLFSDRQGRVVGAAHAGWRGLAGNEGVGILETCVSAMKETMGQASDDQGQGLASGDLLAWLGPCIGPGEFEVGDDVRLAMMEAHPAHVDAFKPLPRGGKWLCDLQQIARWRLAEMGVTSVSGNDGSDAWCTVRQSARFFSHRRDAVRLGSSGRMAACVWLA